MLLQELENTKLRIGSKVSATAKDKDLTSIKREKDCMPFHKGTILPLFALQWISCFTTNPEMIMWPGFTLGLCIFIFK